MMQINKDAGFLISAVAATAITSPNRKPQITCFNLGLCGSTNTSAAAYFTTRTICSKTNPDCPIKRAISLPKGRQMFDTAVMMTVAAEATRKHPISLIFMM